MKVAILGSTGMLGSMLVYYLGKYYDLVATSRNAAYYLPDKVEYRYLDAVESDDDVLKQAIDGCQWVINAIGAIPQRVKSRAVFDTVNYVFPLRLETAALKKSRVIQIATDCVYSGTRGNYTEEDVSDAVDDYGKSKLMGEREIPTINQLRCSIVGPEVNSHYNLLEWFLSQPRNATVNGYVNHQWNGITTWHFAKICRGIIDNNIVIFPMQHLVPADSVSKYELLKLFAKEFMREDIEINPVDAPQSIDRTLTTSNPSFNLALWQTAGYREPPTIAQMVKELAENIRRVR